MIALVAGFVSGWFGDNFVLSAASVIADHQIHHPLKLVIDPLSPLFWLSLATWGLGGLAYWKLDWLRTHLRRLDGWSFDRGFDWLMFGLIRSSAVVTRFFHHGRLEFYLLVVFALFALAAILPLWLMGGLPRWPDMPDLTFYEWSVIGLALLGVTAVILARNRLFAILALGIQGLAVALIFMLFGAPDLSFTQFMVEILSVVILALVMTRLNLDEPDPRTLEDLARDGSVALGVGIAVTMLLFAVLQGTLDTRLSDFFNANSQPLAHGRNIVNVILVDFRGLDTLGEISVVMTAGIAILALIRGANRRERRKS